MSIDITSDPRAALVRTKYFSLRPKPLERWLWQQGLPQTAERVFWLHWEEGMRNGNWCSEIPIKRVARECSIDPSTVTRAYQLLKARELIRRQDPGRDAANPFQQATAITEVRLPRDFLPELGRSPNRAAIGRAPQAPGPPPADVSPSPLTHEPQSVDMDPPQSQAPCEPKTRVRPSRAATVAMWNRASEAEKTRFYLATRDRLPSMAFDADSQLTATDRDNIIRQLDQSASARPIAPMAKTPVPASVEKPRRLSALEIAHARSRLRSISGGGGPDLLRQIIWAVEEGSLSRFPAPLALNIALKKVREGVWTKPHRMPPQWAMAARPVAAPGTCSAA